MATISPPHKLHHYTPAMRGKYGLMKKWAYNIVLTKITNSETSTPNYIHNSPKLFY
jgi:hypothetical protein